MHFHADLKFAGRRGWWLEYGFKPYIAGTNCEATVAKRVPLEPSESSSLNPIPHPFSRLQRFPYLTIITEIVLLTDDWFRRSVSVTWLRVPLALAANTHTLSCTHFDCS